MNNQTVFEQRQEIPFLDRSTSIGRIRNVSLLRRLVGHLRTLKQKTGIEHVIGEWCSHKGFEVVPVGHGIYDSDSAADLRLKYGRGDPLFGFCTLSYLEQRLFR